MFLDLVRLLGSMLCGPSGLMPTLCSHNASCSWTFCAFGFVTVIMIPRITHIPHICMCFQYAMLKMHCRLLDFSFGGFLHVIAHCSGGLSSIVKSTTIKQRKIHTVDVLHTQFLVYFPQHELFNWLTDWMTDCLIPFQNHTCTCVLKILWLSHLFLRHM